jgi:hypothetical protein
MTYNVRTVYQLVTQGESRNGYRFNMRSKAIFGTKEAAEAHISEFEEKCCDPKYLESAVAGTLKTTILELEFYD